MTATKMLQSSIIMETKNKNQLFKKIRKNDEIQHQEHTKKVVKNTIKFQNNH